MTFELNENQKNAVESALSGRFTVITGSAGTGKTTIIKTIVEQAGDLCVLSAFTGKAAARMREATGYSASTLHSAMKYNGLDFLLESFDCPVIIDEASMIDSSLMAEVIRRRPTRLTLIGDQAQLPPVGKGQPFHDLIKIVPERVTDLKINYRSMEAIHEAVSLVRIGEMPATSAQSEKERWSLINSGEPDATHETILEYVKKGHLDFTQDIILCPRNGANEDDPCTIASLNRDIKAIVNPGNGNGKICSGDRVMCLKNFPQSDIWNGTTGTVSEIDSHDLPWITLDTPRADGSKEIALSAEQARNIQLAYALTVHKSQGSQYRRVVFAALMRDAFTMLDRSLIYTAVTRAQAQCVVVGQKAAFAKGISTVKDKRTVLQILAQEGVRNANL